MVPDQSLLLTAAAQNVTLCRMETLFAVITHNVVPMHAEPKRASEQVSQTILGTRVLLLEGDASFVRIRTPDRYEGWVSRLHLRSCADEEPYGKPDWPLATRHVYRVVDAFADVFAKPDDCSVLRTKLVWGAWVRAGKAQHKHGGVYRQVSLPFGTHIDDGEQSGYVRAESLTEIDKLPKFSGKAACALASKFIGTPYLWGGSTPFGFDCSGFVQAVYGILGIIIPRDAHLQAMSPLGVLIPDGKPMRSGDLLFFSGASNPHNRAITHVGMALDKTTVIHAYGRKGVSIDTLEAMETEHGYIYRGGWRYRTP